MKYKGSFPRADVREGFSFWKTSRKETPNRRVRIKPANHPSFFIIDPPEASTSMRFFQRPQI
jgi:hypothetical protein